MIMVNDKRLKLTVNIFIEILQNYIDKFTIYQVPTYLQLIYFNQQLQSSNLVDPYPLFQQIIEELETIDKILEIRNLRHLQICNNLSQLLITLLASSNNFLKVHDKILTNIYKSSISYKEYQNEIMITETESSNILKNENFKKFHRERIERLKVNDRRIFGNSRC